MRASPDPGRRLRPEQGFALVVVVMVATVIGLLAIAALGFGLSSQAVSRRDQDWNAALAAAEAGVDDYLFRLNHDGNYWVYGPANPPPDGNGAFASWVEVPGGNSPARFRYDADPSTIASDGSVVVTSTGRVGDVERTVRVTLRRRNFLDYLYFTEFETMDPASYTGTPFTAAQAQERCARHFYGASGNARDPRCTEITFVSADVIDGPLHSNDAILVCGTPRFNGETSTSWAGQSGVRYRSRSGCSPGAPSFARAGDPREVVPLAMPPSNSALKNEVATGTGGCLYTGPTRIRLNGNASMNIKSPFSRQTNDPGCPTNGTGPLPVNGVVYVQNVPSAALDPNYTNGCPFSVSGRSHPLGLPQPDDLNTYGCRDGDVFIEGALDGLLTVAAENDIVVTGNTTYRDGLGGDDVLGLVANNYVEIYHPVRCTAHGSGSNCNLEVAFPGEGSRGAPFDDPLVQGAVLSLNHSFRVQMHGAGRGLGTLRVEGAIAQRYRGPVGTNSNGNIVSGFAKGYSYDQRLQYLSPPRFLDPVASAWGVATWAEVDVPDAYR